MSEKPSEIVTMVGFVTFQLFQTIQKCSQSQNSVGYIFKNTLRVNKHINKKN